jgi:hypothetical protein
MFIRWKGRYAYLEQRYPGKDGKVNRRSKYLGQNPLLMLEKMMAAGELGEHEFKKLVSYIPEGTLKTTMSDTLTIYNEVSCLLRNHRIAVFFRESWLTGLVSKDEHGWYLKDDKGKIIGLRPGIKVRLLI